MAEFRSDRRSYGGGDRKLEIIVNQTQTNSSRWSEPPTATRPPHRVSNNNKVVSNSSRTSAAAAVVKSSWSLNDPEMKRRKRVVKYKSYAVEGKVKASFGKGFRWIRNKCSEIVYGH